jgi:hypothetical protein
VTEPGTEGSVVDRTANLEQEIGPSSGPSHLLQLVHSSIDQEVRRPFGDRRADAQAGTISLATGCGFRWGLAEAHPEMNMEC